MAMGKRRRRSRQTSIRVATHDLPRSAAHPFYMRLNQMLDHAGFDGHVETLCQRFYAADGRPGLPPGRYFRMLLLGYFEGLDSERAIAWRAADSLSIRSFLDLELHEAAPVCSGFASGIFEGSPFGNLLSSGTLTAQQSVPEPASLLLLGFGLAGVAARRRRAVVPADARR